MLISSSVLRVGRTRPAASEPSSRAGQVVAESMTYARTRPGSYASRTQVLYPEHARETDVQWQGDEAVPACVLVQSERYVGRHEWIKAWVGAADGRITTSRWRDMAERGVAGMLR